MRQRLLFLLFQLLFRGGWSQVLYQVFFGGQCSTKLRSMESRQRQEPREQRREQWLKMGQRSSWTTLTKRIQLWMNVKLLQRILTSVQHHHILPCVHTFMTSPQKAIFSFFLLTAEAIRVFGRSNVMPSVDLIFMTYKILKSKIQRRQISWPEGTVTKNVKHTQFIESHLEKFKHYNFLTVQPTWLQQCCMQRDSPHNWFSEKNSGLFDYIW